MRAALLLLCAEKGHSGVCAAQTEVLAAAPRRCVYGGGGSNKKVRASLCGEEGEAER